MIKFYLKDKEVKLWDKILYSYEKEYENGSIFVLEKCILTEDKLTELVNKGIIQKKYQECSQITVDAILNKIAARIGWKPQKVANYLKGMLTIYPTAVFQTILKEVAIILDKEYSDHIKDSKEIWVVSLVNKSIIQLNKENIADYTSFAAFRTEKDAELGLRISSKIMHDLNNHEDKEYDKAKE